MPKQLPGAWELIQDSWQQFLKNWNQTTKISVWILYFGLAEFGIYLMAKFMPAASLLLIPLSIGLAVVTIWIGARLTMAQLRLEEGKPIGDIKVDEKMAWSLFFPMLLVSLLQCLIILGGFILLIIPGIYLAVILSFSQMALIDQDKHGLEALSFSRRLVTGRWWAVLWRTFSSSLVFGLGLLIIQSAIMAIFSLIIGPTHFFGLMTSENPDQLFGGTMSLLSSVLQAATLPLFFGYQVKLYRALLKTK